jgi:hypothetical protein
MNSREFVDYLKRKYFGENYEKLSSIEASYPAIGTKAFNVLTKDWAMGELWHAEDAASQALRLKIDDDIKVALFEQSWEEANHFQILAKFVRDSGDKFDINEWYYEVVLNAPEWRAIYDFNPNDPILYFAARNFAGETVGDYWMRKVAEVPGLDKKFREEALMPQIEDEGKHAPLGEKVLERYCTNEESQRKAELGVRIGLNNNSKGVAAMLKHAENSQQEQ